jgi:hypothetical protein
MVFLCPGSYMLTKNPTFMVMVVVGNLVICKFPARIQSPILGTEPHILLSLEVW